MVLVQRWPFFQLFFAQYRQGTCLLRYSRTKEMAFQAIKTRSSKTREIDIFLNGLTHGFCPKMAIFATFFLGAIQTRKISFTIFQNEKMLFQAIKTRSSKSGKTEIFLEGLTHGFGAKIAIFPTSFFQAISTRKMSFTIFQNEKNAFLAYKTRSSKSRKIDIFLKGLTLGFGPKMAFFPTFFFGAIQTRNMSFTILQNEGMPSRL